MKGLRIRDALPGNRGAVEILTLSAYQEYAAVMRAHWERYRQNILATLAAVAPAAQIVAAQEGRILGAVLFYPLGSVIAAQGGEAVTLTWPEVRLLAVAPAARCQGIGTALMHECVRRARQSGAVALALHTMDIMQVAMRIYERMGFERSRELDFQPVPDVIVKGYRLNLRETAP
jgi:GNAT superfamily N-acetyltransferase